MPDEQTVTRTYRAAIRIGEDFITLEETVSLPTNASDDEIQAAVDLGWRIYRAQREAVERQIEETRAGRVASGPPTQNGGASYAPREPDAPASDKQRNYIARLQDNLFWNSEQLIAYAAERGINDLGALSKGQASALIEAMKKVDEERRTAPKPDYGTPPLLAAIAAAGDEPPPPEPNGNDGTDIPF